MPFDGAGAYTEQAVGTPSLLDRVRWFFFRTSMPRQILITALGLIEDRRHWAQYQYRTHDNRYCAVGAQRCASAMLQASTEQQRTADQLMLIIARRHGFWSVERMNDKSSHEDVVLAFRAAIALA